MSISELVEAPLPDYYGNDHCWNCRQHDENPNR